MDHSSNIRVSSAIGSSRRDSWDAIAKTKHMMSANRLVIFIKYFFNYLSINLIENFSLESLANLADSQLNTDLSFDRSAQDSETRRNTQLNKFSGFTEESFNSNLDNLAGGYKSMDIKTKSKDETDADGYYVSIFNSHVRIFCEA